MKVKYFLVLSAIMCFAFASFFLWRASPALKDYINQSTAENSMLTNFQTVTVEVVFPSSNLKSVLGYNADTLSDLAVEIVCSRIKAEFGSRRIACGRYGKPYSFRTNPLNLAIVFQAQRVEGVADQYNIRTTFERSSFFLLLRTPESPTLKERYKEFKQSGKGDYFLQSSTVSDFRGTQRDKKSSRYIRDKASLKRRIEFISNLIVEDMNPDEDSAAKQEKNFLDIVR